MADSRWPFNTYQAITTESFINFIRLHKSVFVDPDLHLLYVLLTRALVNNQQNFHYHLIKS